MNMDEMVADVFMSCCEEQIRERLSVDKIPDNIKIKLDNAVSWKESSVQDSVFEVIYDIANETVSKVLEDNNA